MLQSSTAATKDERKDKQITDPTTFVLSFDPENIFLYHCELTTYDVTGIAQPSEKMYCACPMFSACAVNKFLKQLLMLTFTANVIYISIHYLNMQRQRSDDYRLSRQPQMYV